MKDGAPRGRPSVRSAIVFRCISSLPPAMRSPGGEEKAVLPVGRRRVLAVEGPGDTGRAQQIQGGGRHAARVFRIHQFERSTHPGVTSGLCPLHRPPKDCGLRVERGETIADQSVVGPVCSPSQIDQFLRRAGRVPPPSQARSLKSMVVATSQPLPSSPINAARRNEDVIEEDLIEVVGAGDLS